jgi:hypothetical protein
MINIPLKMDSLIPLTLGESHNIADINAHGKMGMTRITRIHRDVKVWIRGAGQSKHCSRIYKNDAILHSCTDMIDEHSIYLNPTPTP